jgi:hypothetical protein
MMPEPTLLTRKQICDTVWDSHISQSRQCVIYGFSWYLDIVCEEWEALVWPDADNFSIVMPLPLRKKLGIRVLYQPLFCQYLGIFSKHTLTAEQCGQFLQTLAGHFPCISCYAFNPCNYPVMRNLAMPVKGLDFEVFQTHWLNLEQPYSNIYASYTKDRKKSLKRATKTAWQFVKSNDLDPLINLFAHHHAKRIGKINASAYSILRKLGKYCLENGTGTLTYAHVGAQIHAGILLVRIGRRAIYLFNAADGIGRKGNARAAMLDAFFRDNAGTTSVFDFESPQNHSVAHYYAGFGAVAVPYYSIRRNALRFPLKQIQQFRKWLWLKTS